MSITIGPIRSYISSNSAFTEKTNYNKEIVSEINVIGNVHLNGTTVNGSVNSGGTIEAKDAIVTNMNAGGEIRIENTISSGNILSGGYISSIKSSSRSLIAGGNISIVKSTSAQIAAGGSISALKCEQLGDVRAGGSIEIGDCSDVNTVSALQYVTLFQSTVRGKVLSNTEANIQNSIIKGTLTCRSNHLRINGSTIGTIDLRCFSAFRASVGNDTTSIVISNGAGSVGRIVMGPSGILNNVVIKGIPFYPNQERPSPVQKPKNGPKQVLALNNCTVKNIIFEGENGEVILSGESILTGTITGGKVKAPSKDTPAASPYTVRSRY